MSYELQVGWRYLYRGTRSRHPLYGAFASVAVMVLGIYLLLASNGSSPAGVITTASGMFATVVFALLSLFSVFTAVAVLGVVLGVAALTVVLAVTTGFQSEFREKILGVNAHVIIMKTSNDFDEYRDVEEVARGIDAEVRSVQPFIFAEMLVTRGKPELSGGVAIKGVDPERVASVLDLQKHMVEGSVEVLGREPKDGNPAPIILGRELAHKLKAKTGDHLTVVAPLSNVDFETWSVTGDAPKTRKFSVAGIFYSGFDEYDRRLMYASLRQVQELLGQGDQVMGVELKVENVDRARAIADKLEAALGASKYVIQDWYELNRNLFTALTLQKIVLVIILTLIIIVATFNMVSSLTMMVIKKTREIAIFKSMGSSSSSVAQMFLVVGITIGGIGTAIGLAMGLVLCYVVSEYGYQLDPKVYLIDQLPIAINPIELAIFAVVAVVISAVATLFPSTKASSLRPVEGLRHD
ncbi:MAG: ABC transporter permease [Proteobacteria bacterium]|nr:ABC transporter permease [Pseudomonadota bacterium]